MHALTPTQSPVSRHMDGLGHNCSHEHCSHSQIYGIDDHGINNNFTCIYTHSLYELYRSTDITLSELRNETQHMNVS